MVDTSPEDGKINCKAFLARYKVTPGAGWQSRLLSHFYEQLSQLNLTETVQLLDKNNDGMVWPAHRMNAIWPALLT